MISFSKFSLWYAPRVLIGIAVVLISMAMGNSLSIGNILLFLGMLTVGILIFYSLFLFTCTLSIWFVKIGDVWVLSYTMMEIGRFPMAAYPRPVRVLLTYMFPVAFVSTVPAQAATSQLTSGWAFGAVLYAAAAFWASRFFWRYSLTHYNSASS